MDTRAYTAACRPLAADALEFTFANPLGLCRVRSFGDDRTFVILLCRYWSLKQEGEQGVDLAWYGARPPLELGSARPHGDMLHDPYVGSAECSTALDGADEPKRPGAFRAISAPCGSTTASGQRLGDADSAVGHAVEDEETVADPLDGGREHDIGDRALPLLGGFGFKQWHLGPGENMGWVV